MLKAHFDQVVTLFETLEECNLKVRFEKCHMLMTKVKYCGHILHDGRRSTAPSKVDAIRNRMVDMIRTPKQMQGFLVLVNGYSIYIKNYADLAAPLMQSLHGKYKHAEKVQGQKGRCKIAKEDNFIRWTDEMKANFEKIKQAICTTCELPGPKNYHNYHFHPAMNTAKDHANDSALRHLRSSARTVLSATKALSLAVRLRMT